MIGERANQDQFLCHVECLNLVLSWRVGYKEHEDEKKERGEDPFTKQCR